MSAYSCIYSGEGYYVRTDKFFCEDIAVKPYQQTAENVEYTLILAVEYVMAYDSESTCEGGNGRCKHTWNECVDEVK